MSIEKIKTERATVIETEDFVFILGEPLEGHDCEKMKCDFLSGHVRYKFKRPKVLPSYSVGDTVYLGLHGDEKYIILEIEGISATIASSEDSLNKLEEPMSVLIEDLRPFIKAGNKS